jgi:hypothetical protein
MMLLYQGREASTIQSVRFSPDGACLVAATQADQVRWFDAAERVTSRGSWDSGIEIVDVAFSSTGWRLAVIGRARQADGSPESELTLLMAAPFGQAPSARHRLPPKVGGRWAAEYFSAPTFLPPPLRSHPFLVGTVDGVLGIDPRTGAARWRLTTTHDFGFVARRGLTYLARPALLVVAFDMHPGLWLMVYQRDRHGQFKELRQFDCWAGCHTGAALNPSGRLLVVGVQEDLYLHPVEAGADARLGALHVYETERLAKVGTFEVRATLDRDFGRQELAPGDGRRVPRGGGPDSPVMYVPLALMSNPAFLDDRRVAFGMPGGEVRLLDVQTGQAGAISDRPRHPIYRLDCAPAQRRIAAGFADGTVCVWGIGAGQTHEITGLA